MAGAADFAVDSFETVIAGLPIDKLAECTTQLFEQKPAFRDVLERFVHATSPLQDVAKAAGEWTEAHERRMFGLRRWIDEPVVADTTKTKLGAKTDASVTLKPVPGVPRQRMDWKQLVDGFEAGLANENDLYDDLLGVRPPQKTTPGYTSMALVSVFRRWTNPPASCTRAVFPRAWTPLSVGRSSGFWRLSWRTASRKRSPARSPRW